MPPGLLLGTKLGLSFDIKAKDLVRSCAIEVAAVAIETTPITECQTRSWSPYDQEYSIADCCLQGLNA